jgi:hypothetical protein
MRLVNQMQQVSQTCKLCQKFATKTRRREAEARRYESWEKEGLVGQLKSSAEKCLEMMHGLDREIQKLQAERMQRYQDNLRTRGGYERIKATTAEPSDSGYHSGNATDIGSIFELSSIQSLNEVVDGSFNEGVRHFGDTLIAKSGALAWADCALNQHSPEEMNKKLNKLLNHYTNEVSSHSGDSTTSTEITALLGINKFICKYRPQISQYVCLRITALEEKPASMAEGLRELNKPLSLLERIGLQEKATSDCNEAWTPENENVDEIDLDENILENNIIGDFLVSGPPIWNLATGIRNSMYCDHQTKMANIRQVVSRGISGLQSGLCTHCKAFEADSLELSSSDRAESSEQQSHYCIKFGLDWKPLEFFASQYGNRVPEIARIVTLSGSAFYGFATTCSDYLNQNWPSTSRLFLPSFQDGLTSIIKGNGKKRWVRHGKYSSS